MALGVFIVEHFVDFLCIGLASTSLVLVICFVFLRLRAQRHRHSAYNDDGARSYGKYERPVPPTGVSTFNLPELRRKNDDSNEASPRVSGY